MAALSAGRAQASGRGGAVTDPTAGGHAATARLLEEAFPGAGVGAPEYLSWLYDESPFGEVIETNRDDSQGRAAHYAVVPLTLVEPDRGLVHGALSLNTAVHERARLKGLFTELAEQTFAKARARGVRVVVGVANANSTRGFVGRLHFSLVAPLPVAVVPRLPLGDAGLRSSPVTPALLESADFASLDRLLESPHGLARRWTIESLRWRLAAPGRGYAIHVGDEAFAVSTPATRFGRRAAVLCAVFSPQPLSRLGFARLAASACRHHRAAAAIRLGINRHLPAAGIPLPRRLKDSPLNLIYRDLDDQSREPPRVARWEALDFDAF
jgi:GNAT superfamily N-acetyltransferase